MTELHKKNILIQAEYLKAKEQELKEVLKELTKAPKTADELDDINIFLLLNGLSKYV